MSFDLSKLPVKTAAAISPILGLMLLGCVGILSWLSYSANQPFIVHGKEFGFGSGELAKKTSQLSKSSEAVAELQEKLTAANKEIEQLRDSNLKLVAQQQARAAYDAAMWFPVDDIEFDEDESFSGHDGKRPLPRKWSSPDSELTLRVIELGLDEVVLETNLPPPENKVRLNRNSCILVTMDKWEYKLSVLSAYYGQATIRVERRSKVRG